MTFRMSSVSMACVFVSVGALAAGCGEAPASADSVDSVSESEVRSRCKKIDGKARDVWPTESLNVTTGVITHDSTLRGTTQYVVNLDVLPTPNPNVISLTSDLTITTHRGVVDADVTQIYDFTTGIWTQMATINGANSTGRFAGATGTLFFPNGATEFLEDGQAYPSDLVGQICFASLQALDAN